MKITFTYTDNLDWYDFVGAAFAVIMSVYISKLLVWNWMGCAFLAFVLGMLAPHLAACLRHPPQQPQDQDKNTD